MQTCTILLHLAVQKDALQYMYLHTDTHMKWYLANLFHFRRNSNLTTSWYTISYKTRKGTLKRSATFVVATYTVLNLWWWTMIFVDHKAWLGSDIQVLCSESGNSFSNRFAFSLPNENVSSNWIVSACVLVHVHIHTHVCVHTSVCLRVCHPCL